MPNDFPSRDHSECRSLFSLGHWQRFRPILCSMQLCSSITKMVYHSIYLSVRTDDIVRDWMALASPDTAMDEKICFESRVLAVAFSLKGFVNFQCTFNAAK